MFVTGNSGAPLFIRNEEEKITEQLGIVSWGIGNLNRLTMLQFESFGEKF